MRHLVPLLLLLTTSVSANDSFTESPCRITDDYCSTEVIAPEDRQFDILSPESQEQLDKMLLQLTKKGEGSPRLIAWLRQRQAEQEQYQYVVKKSEP